MTEDLRNIQRGCSILIEIMLPVFPALLLSFVAPLADCVPARWDSSDPTTLRLLAQSPVNCILLDRPFWDAAFVRAAQATGLRVLPVIGSGDDTTAALVLKPDGLVLMDTSEAPLADLPRIRLLPRHALTFASSVEGTTQGLWPGIRVEKDGAATALPTGAPWIHTNGGFLRFVRSNRSGDSTFWMAMRPPDGQVLRGRHYLQALADAAFSGGVWVLALDGEFRKGLFAGDERFQAEWAELIEGWKFLVQVQEFCRWRSHSTLSLIQDAGSGALFSGGFADMLAARHIPATIATPGRIAGASSESTQVLLNIDPLAVEGGNKALLLDLAKKGITIINSPLEWNPGRPASENFTFPEDQIKGLADAWREINAMLGRRNFGLRVFGAPSTLSQLKISPDGRKVAITLLNYSDYPVQNISLHLAAKYSKAAILTRSGSTTPAIFPSDNGIEIEMESLADVAVVVVE
jgi:hypothetical protein